MARISAGGFDVSGLDTDELAEFDRTKEQKPDADAVDVVDHDPVPRDVAEGGLEDDSDDVEVTADSGGAP